MRRLRETSTWSLRVLAVAWLASFGGWAAAAEPVAQPEAKAEKPRNPPAALIDASKYPDLQAAFDAVPESGGLVRLPPGNFTLSAPLVLSRGNTRVEGAGAATCLVNGNTEGTPALIVRPPELDKNPQARLWRVQLADFRIQGDPDAVDAKSTKPTSGDGLLAQNINEIYVHGLSIDHNGGHGINLVHCLEDARVSDSILTYNAQAGLNIVGGHDIVVNANQFEENADAVRCTDSFNLCMTGNNLDDHLANGVVIENTYGSVLSGNMIEECQGTAVILDRDCYGITVSANVLADNFGGGVDLRDAWGCAVSANTFTIDVIFALAIRPGSGRITVTGNNFSDSYIGENTRRIGRPNLATGVLLEGTSDVVVSGNLFSGLDQYAVKADADCRRVSVTGNIVMEVHQGSSEKLPPIDLGGAQESVCEMNIIKERETVKEEKAPESKPK
ncbi:MAG: right-handed parallel beta-helix repeat-containing protein [Planctomycetota bacterium]